MDMGAKETVRRLDGLRTACDLYPDARHGISLRHDGKTASHQPVIDSGNELGLLGATLASKQSVTSFLFNFAGR